MKKVSIIIAHRHATSFTLDDEFYVALKQIAEKQKISL
ncbi:MAG: ribbon-helix-helix domain-containing protein, partial [Alphaproteobacteria bacterium]|nr:ribbon-helix-helix domain-containing protein [Alphaproteobacteria bacterium]